MGLLTTRGRDILQRLFDLPTSDELTAVRHDFAAFAENVKSRLIDGDIPSAEMQEIYTYVHNVSVISTSMVESEATYKLSNQALERELIRYLGNDTSAAKHTTRRPEGVDTDDENISYDPWRLWYSDRLAHPYYDSRERDWLLKQIPGMTPQKMQTWFVNVRRRSGWSELYRKYADNQRENMEAIFKACDDPDPSVSEKVAPEARKLVAKIRQYLTLESKKTEIAPWLQEVLNRYKQSSITSIEASDNSPSVEDVKPITSSSPSKKRSRSHKRKASDADNIIAPKKRSKPSLYETAHHPMPSASQSPLTPSKSTPPVATVSTTLQSSPDLQTPPSVHTKVESPEQYDYTIPPFAAWTAPPQEAPSHLQPLSAFVPARAHSYALPPIQVQAPGQSFTANNSYFYNVSPTAYTYHQQQPQYSLPMPYGMYAGHAGPSWNQPQWPHNYAYPSGNVYYSTPPPLSYPGLSTYSTLSSLSNTHPGKRKYNQEEEEETPSTPTGSYKRGRTSTCDDTFSEPSIAEVSRYVRVSFPSSLINE